MGTDDDGTDDGGFGGGSGRCPVHAHSTRDMSAQARQRSGCKWGSVQSGRDPIGTAWCLGRCTWLDWQALSLALKRRKTSFSMRCSSSPAPQRPGPAPCAARSKEVSASVGERALVWAAGTAVRPVVRRSECARRARQLTEAASEGRRGSSRRPQARAGASRQGGLQTCISTDLHSISSPG